MVRSSTRDRTAAYLRKVGQRRGWTLTLLAFAILATLIGLFSLQAMQVASDRREAEEWHVHTLEVLLLTSQFRDTTFAVLRGERGYLLTHSDSFLEPFVAGQREAPPLLARLRAQVGDNLIQIRNLGIVESRLGSYNAVLGRSVVLERAGHHEAALSIVRAGFGRYEFERLQESIDAVEAEERRLLIERRERLSLFSGRHEQLGYWAAALIVMLVAVAALAASAALAAKRRAALATEELRRIATVDELTGLPNRRHLLQRLDEEIARGRRAGHALCLATIDVDHFKRINDAHGHPGGDAVLRVLAGLFSDGIRAGDVIGRIGGEEFALLLPNTDVQEARLVCDRLRGSVAAKRLPLPDGISVAVTISTGVAQLATAEAVEALMRRSDDALYLAKSGGRNQVRLAA